MRLYHLFQFTGESCSSINLGPATNSVACALLTVVPMRFAKRRKTPSFSRGTRLTIGFVPTLDCATLVAARELGLFEKHGLNVRLSREVGWATIREKILHEELDAAATHASMLFSIYCGIGVLRRPCLTGLMMSCNGSAITLSNELWDIGVRDAQSLGRVLREQKTGRVLVFGVVLQLSSQHYNLRKWLISGGIDPQREVRIVVIPSTLIYETFRDGFLDGYCVAEPWNSTAVIEKTGWIVATTGEISPVHPEKVLLVLQDFAESRRDEHLHLIAALIEASQFCDAPENRRELAQMLCRPHYFDLDLSYLINALVPPCEAGKSQPPRKNMVDYNAYEVGAPDRTRGKWVYELVRALGSGRPSSALHPDAISKVFRKDIYDEAMKQVRSGTKVPPKALAESSRTEELNPPFPIGISDAELTATPAR